jgi:hypothetical protein
MTSRFAIVLAGALALLAAAPSPPVSGTWSLEPAATAGKVNIQLRSTDPSGKEDVESSFDVSTQELGLSAVQLASQRGDVAFTWGREAGSFACKGWLSEGKGGGTFVFTASSEYLAKMHAAGYDLASPRDQIVAAILDINTGYVAAIAAAGYPRLPFQKLIAFRALKIDDVYVRAMRAAFGSADLGPEQIISLQALRVTPEYVADMRAAGVAIDTAQDAIRMRALKVDAAFVRSMAAVGFTHLSSDELVRLRALGIDAAYVKRVQAHGFANLTVDQLVRLKAMNVI